MFACVHAFVCICLCDCVSVFCVDIFDRLSACVTDFIFNFVCICVSFR